MFFGGAVPFTTPFPTYYLTSSLPFCFLLSACAPGVVSVQREVVCIAGIDAVLRSPRTVVMLRLDWNDAGVNSISRKFTQIDVNLIS